MLKPQKVLNRNFDNSLYIIAGLEAGVSSSTINHLKKSDFFKKYLYVSVPGRSQKPIYGEGAIAHGLRSIADIVARNVSNEGSLISPGRIILLYIDDESAEEFLRGFDFFCFPQKIDLGDCGHDVIKCRRRLEFIQEKIKKHIIDLEKNESIIKKIEDEVRFRRKKTNLLLPPSNFYIDRQSLMRDFLIGLIRGGFSCLGMEGFNLKKFNSSNLPNFLSGKKKIDAYLDVRGLVFPPCKDDQCHALPRAISSEGDVSEMRRVLNCLYRLGIPIYDGFHYDVQREGRDTLGGL